MTGVSAEQASTSLLDRFATESTSIYPVHRLESDFVRAARVLPSRTGAAKNAKAWRGTLEGAYDIGNFEQTPDISNILTANRHPDLTTHVDYYHIGNFDPGDYPQGSKPGAYTYDIKLQFRSGYNVGSLPANTCVPNPNYPTACPVFVQTYMYSWDYLVYPTVPVWDAEGSYTTQVQNPTAFSWTTVPLVGWDGRVVYYNRMVAVLSFAVMIGRKIVNTSNPPSSSIQTFLKCSPYTVHWLWPSLHDNGVLGDERVCV